MKLSHFFNWEMGVGILEDNVFGQEPTPAPSFIQDRRKEPRFTLSLPIKYRKCGIQKKWQSAQTVDVSRNGIRLSLDHDLPVGTQIDLDVKLPQISKTVRLQGIIVWTKPAHNNTTSVECGVAFNNLRRLSNKEKIMYFMADRICGLAAKHSSHLVCRPAITLEDMENAFRLVYEEYSARGYCTPNPSGIHYSWQSVLPHSQVFLLERDGNLLGTVSLFTDSPCGLPMDLLYKKELDAIRGENKQLAEVGLLTLSSKLFPKRSFSLTDFQKLTGTFRLFKILFDYARLMNGVTDIIIGVHPKHRELYRYLSFEPFGQIKNYPGACNKPALPLHLDIPRAIQSVSLTHGPGHYFLNQTASEESLKKRFAWNTALVEDFLIHKRPLWAGLTVWQRHYVEQCYPDIKLPPAKPEGLSS